MVAKKTTRTPTLARSTRFATDRAMGNRVRARLTWMDAAREQPIDDIEWRSAEADYKVSLKSSTDRLELQLTLASNVSRPNLEAALQAVRVQVALAQQQRGLQPRRRRVRTDWRVERAIFFQWLSRQPLKVDKMTTRPERIARIWKGLTEGWPTGYETDAPEMTFLTKWPQAMPAYLEWLGRYGPRWVPNPEWDALLDDTLGDSVPVDEVRKGLRIAESRSTTSLRLLAKKQKRVGKMVEKLSAENVEAILKRTRQLLRTLKT